MCWGIGGGIGWDPGWDAGSHIWCAVASLVVSDGGLEIRQSCWFVIGVQKEVRSLVEVRRRFFRHFGDALGGVVCGWIC